MVETVCLFSTKFVGFVYIEQIISKLMKSLEKILLLVAVVFMIGLFSCKKPVKEGSVNIRITHTVDGQPAVYNQINYINAAGNQYQISEIQWFITELALLDEANKSFSLMGTDEAWYIDTDLEETMQRTILAIPEGNYKALEFVFGFTEETNLSNRFVNPPESFMFWPEHMGGGYHYMKLNGKWLNPQGQKEPFNFHLGIGQIYDGEEIIDFVHNYFKVSLPMSDLKIIGEKSSNLVIEMQIENWFQSPNVYDHNEWGGAIMQKQDAMRIAIENGHDVFNVMEDL